MQSPSQARVVDPILTDHVRGYTNAEFVGYKLFPRVNMPVRGMKRIEFDRSSFRRPKTERAPGSKIAQVSFGYDGKPVALTQHALAGVTPLEYQQDAEAVPGIDIQQQNVDTVLYVIGQELEIRQATVARNAANYAAANKVSLAGGDKWTDPGSDPLAVVSDAKETIRQRIGRRPNLLTLGGSVCSALQRHPTIKAHFAYTNAAAVSLAMLAAYFDVAEVVAGDGIYDDEGGVSQDIWGNDAILAYVAPAGTRGIKLPSYGYTYQLADHPYVEAVQWDGSIRSWVNNVFDEHSPELVGADAGFLIQNAR